MMTMTIVMMMMILMTMMTIMMMMMMMIVITVIIFVHNRFLSMAFHAIYHQKVLLRIFFRALN